MSPYASFSVTYRVEVQVPEEVFRVYGNTPEYEQASLASARAVRASGQDCMDGTIEWAEASTRTQCEDFAAFWHNQILQWQSDIRLKA